MYPDYSQMPPMTSSGGLLGAMGDGLNIYNKLNQTAPVQGNPQIPAQQPAPGGSLPQGNLAQSPSANPVRTMENPMVTPGAGSDPLSQANSAPMSANMMGAPGSPAPTPGTNPAIPAPQAPMAKPNDVSNPGTQDKLSEIPSSGKTGTGQKSGSLNQIAMQIMGMGGMGGAGGGAMGAMF